MKRTCSCPSKCRCQSDASGQHDCRLLQAKTPDGRITQPPEVKGPNYVTYPSYITASHFLECRRSEWLLSAHLCAARPSRIATMTPDYSCYEITYVFASDLFCTPFYMSNHLQDFPHAPESSPGSASTQIDTPPDGGRLAWLVVLGSALALFSTTGVNTAYVSPCVGCYLYPSDGIPIGLFPSTLYNHVALTLVLVSHFAHRGIANRASICWRSDHGQTIRCLRSKSRLAWLLIPRMFTSAIDPPSVWQPSRSPGPDARLCLPRKPSIPVFFGAGCPIWNR